MVIYRSKIHATRKRNYQFMPALTWLRLLMSIIPDKHEHLVRYNGYYSNRPRGARKQVEPDQAATSSTGIEASAGDARRKALSIAT